MERWEEGERESKTTSLVDCMSLEPGVAASSPPATGKEKNKYEMWDGVDGGEWQKNRKEQIIVCLKKKNAVKEQERTEL